MKNKTWLYIAVLLLMAVPILAVIPDQFTLPLYLETTSGTAQTGIKQFTFNIYDVSSGGAALFTQYENVSLSSKGIGSAILYDAALQFDVGYWVGITYEPTGIGSGTETTSRINWTKSGYAHRANVSDSAFGDCPGEYMQNITSAGIECAAPGAVTQTDIRDQAVNITSNVTFRNLTITNDLALEGNLDLDGEIYMPATGFAVFTGPGGSLRFNITIGGNIYTAGTWTNDGALRILGDSYLGNAGATDYVYITGGLNVTGKINLSGVGITTWDEVNGSASDTFMAESNITGLGVYYYDIYNLTTLLNSTYINATGDSTLTGDLIIQGNLTIIGNHINATVINQYLNGSFYPTLTNTFIIGNGTNLWKHIYANTINGTSHCIGAICISSWDEINKTDGGDSFDQVLNITSNVTFDNLNLTGRGIFFGGIDELTNYTVDNVRLGVYSGTPRLLFENTEGNKWQIDHGGAGLRFYKTGETVTLRVNATGVRMGESGDRRNLEVYGDIITYDPAGAGGNIFVDGNISVVANISAAGLSVERTCLGAVCIDTFSEINGTTSPPAYDQVLNVSGNITFRNLTITNLLALDAVKIASWAEINKTGAADSVGNCSADGSCPIVVYSTNVTWITSNQINFTDTDTHVGANTTYLYNNSALLSFNQTRLNETIDARSDFDTDTNTHSGTNGSYLYNNSDITSFNQTRLNETIDARSDFDTTVGNCSGDGDCDDIVYGSNVTWITSNQINASDTNIRDQDVNISSSVTFANVNVTNVLNVSKIAGTGGASIDVYTHIDLQGRSLLDATIVETNAIRDPDDDILLSNDHIQIQGNIYVAQAAGQHNLSVNGTANISDALFVGDSINLSYTKINTWAEVNKTNVDTTIGNCSGDGDCDEIVYGSNVTWITSNQINFTDTDTHVRANTTYLYNDSDIISFNQTRLNETIDARSDFDTTISDTFMAEANITALGVYYYDVYNITSLGVYYYTEANLTNVLDDNYVSNGTGLVATLLSLDGDTILTWAEINKSAADGVGIENGSIASLLYLNVTKNLTVSENLTVYGKINLSGVGIGSWNEINVTDTFVTSTNVSAWSIYYLDIYNITSQVNTTYVTRTGGNMTGALNMTGSNITDVDHLQFENQTITIKSNTTCMILKGSTATLNIC